MRMETVTPWVFKMTGMLWKNGSEYIFGEDASGVRFWFNAADRGLTGFVERAMMIDAAEARHLTTYVEVGRRPDGSGYLDLLLNRTEFDAQPANQLFRDRERSYDYGDWLAVHRVAPDIAPAGVELYYGVAPADYVGRLLDELS